MDNSFFNSNIIILKLCNKLEELKFKLLPLAIIFI